MPDRVTLKLFVSGHTARSEHAIANLQRICENKLGTTYDLHIVNVLEQPQLAEQAKILATPTLIREAPPPLRRIVGDLSDTESVLVALGLQYSTPHPDTKGGDQ